MCVKWGQVGKKEESEGNWSMHNIELKTVQSSEMTHTATADGTSSSSNTQTLDLHKKIYRFNFGYEPHLKMDMNKNFIRINYPGGVEVKSSATKAIILDRFCF